MQTSHVPIALRCLGIFGTLKLLTSRRLIHRILPSCTTVLRFRDYSYPFHFRHATTDKYVIDEVLLLSQYDCLVDLPNVRTIVDVGANIGTASVFFLNAYPEATLVALEPDPGNFELLRKNISYYHPRAVALRIALWDRPEELTIDRGNLRDGGEWSFQVRSKGASDIAEVQGITLPDLMLEQNLQTIDILKIDIEGAERYIFRQSALPWLERVRTIAIELHDDECRELFLTTISPFGGYVSRHGEVTVWRH
jgi:FkbM family methyltransferase